MRKLIVLGATGYVGKCLVSELKNTNEFVTLTAGRSGCDINVDLESDNYEALVSELTDGDVVFFLAAISSPDICAKEPDRAWRINVDNTRTLIHQLTDKGVKVIFSSSDVVFGKHLNKALDNTPLKPSGVYADMKAAIEKEFEADSLVKVTRFSLVLGKGDKFSEMLQDFSCSGKKLEVFKGFERNVVWVDDVVEGLINLANNWDKYPEKAFNFSGPELIGREKMTKILSTIYKNLQYTVTDAPEGFWVNREKVIETDCKNFSRLLGRQPKSLDQIIEKWV